MFKNSNDKKNATSNPQSGPSSSVNSIGHGTFVEGSINAESDIRIDGEIKGNLKCKGKLILGPQGKITGDIDCQNALIEGQITGTVKVKDLLHVKESAKIDGEISTDQLMVQPGAMFNVNCSMGKTLTASTPKMIKKEEAA
jgi:cytoskeletal protein CcmA (bactofilin family)